MGKRKTMKTSDLFVAALENEGVEYIFALPGELTYLYAELMPYPRQSCSRKGLACPMLQPVRQTSVITDSDRHGGGPIKP